MRLYYILRFFFYKAHKRKTKTKESIPRASSGDSPPQLPAGGAAHSPNRAGGGRGRRFKYTNKKHQWREMSKAIKSNDEWHNAQVSNKNVCMAACTNKYKNKTKKNMAAHRLRRVDFEHSLFTCCGPFRGFDFGMPASRCINCGEYSSLKIVHKTSSPLSN